MGVGLVTEFDTKNLHPTPLRRFLSFRIINPKGKVGAQ